MFNSSLAPEMAAYIELRVASFCDTVVSHDKRTLKNLDQYLSQVGFHGKNLTEDVLTCLLYTS